MCTIEVDFEAKIAKIWENIEIEIFADSGTL